MSRAILRFGVPFAVAVAVVLLPAVASAHPLGNFTINVYSGVSIFPGEVRIHYVLDMAEIPTFQELERIDGDGDGTENIEERLAWTEEKAAELRDGLDLSVAGRSVALDVSSSSMALRPGQGGLEVLRLDATFTGSIPASGSARIEDGNYAGHLGWREIIASGADGEAVADSTVPASSVSDELRSYPSDLLQEPLSVTEATFSFAPGESDVATPGSDARSIERPGVIGGSFAKLIGRGELTVPVVALSLLLAVGFGALHALAPGHGKTLMAAYLVGAGGRMRQAVAVGAAVSLMHTASVLGLGLIVVYAESLFPRPEDVYPWLGLLSGVVAVVLGAALFTIRYRARRRTLAAVHHAGSDDHHPFDDAAEHSHGAARHIHAVPDTPVLSRKGLAALAVAGGILPSPTALVVLLAAVALHRLVFGLALIFAFSIGLAVALIVIGVMALSAREVVSRRMSSRVGQVIPLVSASAIVVVGAFLLARAATQL